MPYGLNNFSIMWSINLVLLRNINIVNQLLLTKILYVLTAGVWSCQDRMDVDQEEASLEQAEFYPLDVKFDEDADVDESEESDDIDEMSQQWKLVNTYLYLDSLTVFIENPYSHSWNLCKLV